MSFIKRFNLISELVEKHIEKNEGEITEIIANEFATEKRSMAYAFEFIVGYRLPQYIRKRKLSVAFHQNEKDGCGWDKVIEIAGYSERSSFDKAFSREYLSSPAQYLKGDRKVELVEPLVIKSVDSNFIKDRNNLNMSYDDVCVERGEDEKREMVFNIKKIEDINRLSRYLDLQSLYELSIGQIMLAELFCSDDVNIYLACSVMEQEYRDLEADDFNEFYKDCLYISINYRCTKDLAERIVSEINKNNYALDVRHLDYDYIGTLGVLCSYREEKGIVGNLSYELFKRIKEKIKPQMQDDTFYSLCCELIYAYTEEEIEKILNYYEEKEYEQDVWYIMQHIYQSREDSEALVELLYKTSKVPIKEMDKEYLWFFEWYESDKRLSWVEKLPYERYVGMKKQVTEQYLYDGIDIEYAIRRVVESSWTLEDSIRLQKGEAIRKAITALRKDYVENVIYSEYFTWEELMKMLDEYYPNKVPSDYSNKLEHKDEIWKLLFHNRMEWSFIDEYESLEIIVASSNGISIEESKAIVRKRLKADGICDFEVDWNYVYLHEHYFGSYLFDEENRWDGTLIPYKLYEQIFAYALSIARSEDQLWISDLAKIAYDLIYNKCSTLEEAFEKYDHYNLDNGKV